MRLWPTAIVGCLWLVAGPALAADTAVETKVPDLVTPLPAGAVKLEGHVGQRLAACLEHRILAQSIPDLVQPFRDRQEVRMWRSEFWGKWFTSAVLAYRYKPTPQLKRKMDEAVSALMETQTADGYIGTYKPEAETDNWDVWGRKYTLLGLLDYYDLTGDAKTLRAARRQADHLLDQVGPGRRDIAQLGWWSGMAAGSILQPMVRLYRATGEPRYLEFAEYIVKRWEAEGGPHLVSKARQGTAVFDMFEKPKPEPKNYGDYGQSKAYEMMSCYEGLCELYRVTGKPDCKEAAEKVYANILASEITVVGSGSHMERWCNGHARQLDRSIVHWMETCVTATWMKLGDELYRLTADPRYVDQFERSAYNALVGALPPDAEWWSHYMPMDGTRAAAPEQCSMHMNCCVANGPRGLFLIPRTYVMQHREGPVVNLYLPGSAKANSAAGPVLLTQSTDFPRSGKVLLAVNPEKPGTFALRLRVPSWSERTVIRLNDGDPLPGVQAGTYLRIEREWKPGDRVEIDLDLRGRVEKAPSDEAFVAVRRGPLVLAIDRRVTRPIAGLTAVRFDVQPDGMLDLQPLADDPSYWLLCGAPVVAADGRKASLRMCDFSSAGQTWDDTSQYRTWIPVPLDAADPFAGAPISSGKH